MEIRLVVSPCKQTMPEWRNWQTRRIQNPVRFTPGVGSTPTFGISSVGHPEELERLYSGSSVLLGVLVPSTVGSATVTHLE